MRTRPCSMASVRLASSSRTNSSTWRYFACRVGLTRPCASLMPERDQHRVVLGEQPVLGPVVAAGRRDLVGARRGVQQRHALLGHPQLVGLGGGVDVPVGERLREQRVHRGLGRLAHQVVGGVRLRGVVRRHLQVAAGLEVDDPDLHATHLASLHDGDRAGPCAGRWRARARGRSASRIAEPDRGDSPPGVRRSQDRGEDDDEDQCPQRHRDHESAVAGVHALILVTGAAAAHSSRVAARRRSPVLERAPGTRWRGRRP